MTEEQIAHDAEWADYVHTLIGRGFCDELIRVTRKPTSRDLEALKEFHQHCREIGVTPVPAEPPIVAAWLMTLMEQGKSKASVIAAARSIELAHDLKNKANPCATRDVRAVLLKNRELDRSTNTETHH